MKITETTIRASLAAPALFADDLVAIFNNRGARDAAVVLTAQSGDWPRLRTAAAIAGRAAADSDASMAGPLVTFAMAAWVMDEVDSELRDLVASVPASDPARRMAVLVRNAVDGGMPGTAWAAHMATIDIATCLAFQPA
jgi:hypothetical protein